MGNGSSDLLPEMPLLAAARHVLFVRMQVVRDHLPPVVHHADQDDEHVHQSRVGTRRADAALRIFRGCLSDKVYRTARFRASLLDPPGRPRRPRLGRVLAGWRERLHAARSDYCPGLDFLLGYGVGQRKLLLGQLEAAGQDQLAEFEELRHRPERLPRQPDDGVIAPLSETWPGRCWPVCARPWSKATGYPTNYVRLHQVRIAGKQAALCDGGVRRLLSASLPSGTIPPGRNRAGDPGRANDSHVAGERLARLRDWLKQHWREDWPRFQPGIEGSAWPSPAPAARGAAALLAMVGTLVEKGSEALLTTVCADTPG